MSTPTTTGYLILGMLATRDWTAYELAELVGRGLDEVWPRADRQLYNVPKTLETDGFVTARKEATGKRERTVYSITTAGRLSLQEWLGTEAKRSNFESEALVRLMVAGEGSADDLRRTLTRMGEQARHSRALFVANAQYMLDSDGGSFPGKMHVLALSSRFMLGHFDHIISWTKWALEQTSDWTDVDHAVTVFDSRAFFEGVVAEARNLS